MSLTNAEKGRMYGKKMAEYMNKQFGVVGELRYNMKTDKWAVTVGNDVPEETGYMNLSDINLTVGNNILVSGGDDDK